MVYLLVSLTSDRASPLLVSCLISGKFIFPSISYFLSSHTGDEVSSVRCFQFDILPHSLHGLTDWELEEPHLQKCSPSPIILLYIWYLGICTPYGLRITMIQAEHQNIHTGRHHLYPSGPRQGYDTSIISLLSMAWHFRLSQFCPSVCQTLTVNVLHTHTAVGFFGHTSFELSRFSICRCSTDGHTINKLLIATAC